MNPRNILPAILLMICAQLWGADVASACPTCKEGISNQVALGYAISILFMMGMPFLIFGFWVVTIVRLRANAKPTRYLVNQRVTESSTTPNFEL